MNKKNLAGAPVKPEPIYKDTNNFVDFLNENSFLVILAIIAVVAFIFLVIPSLSRSIELKTLKENIEITSHIDSLEIERDGNIVIISNHFNKAIFVVGSSSRHRGIYTPKVENKIQNKSHPGPTGNHTNSTFRYTLHRTTSGLAKVQWKKIKFKRLIIPPRSSIQLSISKGELPTVFIFKDFQKIYWEVSNSGYKLSKINSKYYV